MGINCCNKAELSTKGVLVLSSLSDTGDRRLPEKMGSTEILHVVVPPAFNTHSSLGRGKPVGGELNPQERPKRKAHQTLQKDMKNTVGLRTKELMERHGIRRDICQDIKKIKFLDIEEEDETANAIEAEKRKAPGASSVALHSRHNVNLKVAPYHFRIEKSGSIEDKYQTLSVIGEGGFGKVKKIRNRMTNQIKAVKVIAKSKCQMSENFSDEIQILQKIVREIFTRFEAIRS